jgi:DNA-dependent RNA polymerase auxiliary subunit epsilon
MLLKFDEEIDNFHQKKATMTVREIAQQLYDEMTILKITSNLLNKTNHPIEEIAALVGMPVEYVLEVKDHLAEIAAKN